MLVHFPHFQRLSRVEAFGPVLHFWWNPLEHTLHLTGTVLERRAAEHLAHFSFEFFASARDKPWFRRDVNEAGVGRGGELLGDNEGCGVADGEEWRWQCQILLERARGLAFPLRYTIRYVWLQGDKHYRKMDSRNDRLDQQNRCG